MKRTTRVPAWLSPVAMLLATAVTPATAQTRTPLQTIDFPAGYQTVAVIAELEPGQCTARHAHPGIESAYVLEGEAVARFDGKPDLPLGAGRPLQFGPEEMHVVCNTGTGRFKAIAHYIVRKDKPLVLRAP